MTETLFLFLILAGFPIGYYILPWVMHGVSPRETWRRDHER